MNKSTNRALVLFSLIAVLGPLTVVAQSPAHFTIPFGFTVGPKSFGAGQYRVGEVAPQVLQIRADNGRGDIVILSNAGEPSKTQGQAILTFKRYGDRYFLAKLSRNGRGWSLPNSTKEKELIRAQNAPKELDVLASSLK